MSDELQRVDIRDLFSKELEFLSGGNPSVTGKWGITGHMPNLLFHLWKNDIHPLDYYQVSQLLKRETRGDVQISVYAYHRKGDGENTLVEILTPSKATYISYQVDGAELDEVYPLLVQTDE